MNEPRRTSWLGRVFGDGENPLTWSLPVARLPGLVVRVHLVLLVFVAVRLIQSIQTEQAGLVFQIAGLVGLVLLVFMHELGHALAARRAGVLHDRLVLWPLGGLDHGDQPERAGQLVRIAAAGPFVNLLLLAPLAALVLWMTGSWELVFFAPFGYQDAARAALTEGLGAWLVWSLHANNLMLLAFNLLVPMPPLDAGRLVQAAAWRLRGETQGARLSGVVGLIAAAVLAAVGLVANETALLGIAIIGAFVSWQEVARARFLGVGDTEWTPVPDPAEITDTEGPPDGQEVDRILSKISEQGLESLSEEERRVLDRASAAGTDH